MGLLAQNGFLKKWVEQGGAPTNMDLPFSIITKP